MSAIKLVCMDVDGTLLGDDHIRIPDLNRVALQKAFQKGLHLALVSGRLSASLRPIQQNLGITGPLGCFGGALVVDERDQILDQHPITKAQAIRVIQRVRPTGMTIFLFGQNHWYKEKQDAFATVEEEVSCEGTMIGDFETFITNRTTPPFKVLCMSSDHDQVLRIQAGLQEEFGNELSVCLSSPRYIEVSVKGIDKGNAVDVLLSHYHLERRECMAIGDYENDLGMFREAGLSVAMGNAPDDIKAKADCVTDTNQAGGLGKAILSIL
ncbi:MAG: Cof-type HAD-IIB family hydrolase [Sphaerochaeta sp.]|jgi:Cof subfamily protein (haloacid dehalogenase superfamily)|nr:Cof-type HAD-IIB family hydrolase [Sphaerochaeta sp.]MCH3920035.1 Cof-type HAD-IIB family hydrolase [Sphaerochaeta sp.]MCI2103810.1 Cof-type HAD-IIB family hydrolase [Sphaerochaeta sp.]